MRRDHYEAVRVAYQLRHRLRHIGAILDAGREHGPLVTPRHAAWLLAVDESRVRALIKSEQLPSVRMPGPGEGFRLLPALALLQSPTPCEGGRPIVRRGDGSVGRDDGGHSGLCLPLGVYARYGRETAKNRRRTPGR